MYRLVKLAASLKIVRIIASSFLFGNFVRMKGRGNIFRGRFSSLRRRCVIDVRGSGNSITMGSGLFDKMRIDVIGDNNSIIIGDGARFADVSVYMVGSGCTFIMGSNSQTVRTEFGMEDDGSSIIFGDDTLCGGVLRVGNRLSWSRSINISALEGGTIRFGRNVMMSDDIAIRNSDSHVICGEDGNWINRGKDVVLGDHVWVSSRCVILKGVRIASGCVIGGCSVITKSFDELNAVIAGNPARVVKRNIIWDADRIKYINMYKNGGQDEARG